MIAAAAIAGWQLRGGGKPAGPRSTVDTAMHGADASQSSRPAEEIVVPGLSPKARFGEAVYLEKCASCHGVNAAGSDRGPPFIQPIYGPSHHADVAFMLAPRRGVRAHHWRFGDMPPVEDVTDKQPEWIIRYACEMQAANGVYRRSLSLSVRRPVRWRRRSRPPRPRPAPGHPPRP